MNRKLQNRQNRRRRQKHFFMKLKNEKRQNKKCSERVCCVYCLYFWFLIFPMIISKVYHCNSPKTDGISQRLEKTVDEITFELNAAKVAQVRYVKNLKFKMHHKNSFVLNINVP